MEEYQLGRLGRKRAFINMSRKIQDGEVSTEYIAKKYRVKYPNTDVRNEFLVWTRKGSNGFVLYDTHEHVARFIVSPETKAVFVPPAGQKARRFVYEKEIWTPKTTPALTRDALRCVFKHLSGWDLLQCRQVCKEWKGIITKTDSLWPLGSFRKFVQGMFVGASEAQMINYLIQYPMFFLHIVRLLEGKQVQLIRSANKKLIAGRFQIVETSKRLIVDGNRNMSVELFMNAYRQSLV